MSVSVPRSGGPAEAAQGELSVGKSVARQLQEQLPLWPRDDPKNGGKAELSDAAAADNKSEPIHRWVPWIAGFSAQFVRDVIDVYLPSRGRSSALLLDPFAGVGTTLVEGLKAGSNVVGYEINAFAVLAARAKINSIDVRPEILRDEIDRFRASMLRFEADVDRGYACGGVAAVGEIRERARLYPPPRFRSRIPFFSPAVEAKFLFALRHSAGLEEPIRSLCRAALGATMVSYSNYTYEPSLGSRPGAGKPLIENAPVSQIVCRKLSEMLADICRLQGERGVGWRGRQRDVYHTSFFKSQLNDHAVSLLVTSPPYMNNYHYVRNTRPQLSWLDLVSDPGEMRDLEHANFGRFWQTVRQGPVVDLSFEFPELERMIQSLRSLHPEKGHYGGQGWANYVASYFNDASVFVRLIGRQLKPGGYAVIVVGNSIIQGIEFKVDHLIAQMAEQHRMHVDEIRIVRTKRVGNSIIDSSVRNGATDGHRQHTQLYDAALILRA